MRVYTRVVIDLNGVVIEENSYEYNGPVAHCGGGSAPSAKMPIAGRIVRNLYQNGPLKESLTSVLNPASSDAYAQHALEGLTQQIRGGYGARGLANSGIAIKGEQQAQNDFLQNLTQAKQGQAIQILGTASGGPTAIPGSQPRGLFGLK